MLYEDVKTWDELKAYWTEPPVAEQSHKWWLARMDAIFNVLRTSMPPYKVCKEANRLLDACRAAKSVDSRLPPDVRNAISVALVLADQPPPDPAKTLENLIAAVEGEFVHRCSMLDSTRQAVDQAKSELARIKGSKP